MRKLAGLVTDVRPLRASPAYRRLWIGQAVSGIGQQMSLVAVAFEVFSISGGSSFAVGMIGLAGLLPLVIGGLYGGALVDAFDRRAVALVSAAGLWACSIALVVHSVADVESLAMLYVLVAVQSAFYAVNNPARGAILPSLLPPDLLPAANALGMAATNLSFTIGPLVGGVLIAWNGPLAAYAADVILYLAALYSVVRLPRMARSAAGRAPGWRSVVEGLRFLRGAPNVRMTFVLDIFAMAFAQPRALFPALAITVFAAGATSFGVLQAAPGIGAVLVFLVSGWVSRVRHHGRAVAYSIVVYAACVVLAGVVAMVGGGAVAFVCCVAFLAGSGAADMVSAAYRSTILQTAAPDEMRGRMQGVFIVVVAGGPKVGDAVMGSAAVWLGVPQAMALGGALCALAVVLTTWRQRTFWHYDARHPTP